MKKIISFIILFCLFILIILSFFLKGNKDNDKDKIVVAEVTHSVFYAPWYVALRNGYFEDLDIEVILTSGANNVIAAVISGDAQIGLCGAEATFYVNDNKDKVLAFSSLTKRDGQFLVLKNNVKFDDLQDLNGIRILSGRAGGMPLLSFTTALKNEKVNNAIIDNSVDFANLSSAFISSDAEGVNLFEPNATNLVDAGYGYIAAMIGTYSGVVPYTVFSVKETYIKEHKKEIKIFYNAINKGLEYVHSHSSSEIANIIKDDFKDIELSKLVQMVDNYKKNDSWFSNAKLDKDAYRNLQNILLENKEISKEYNFDNLVYVVD